MYKVLLFKFRRHLCKGSIRSFISALGLPFILIRHQNRALRKRFSNRRDFKQPALRFTVDEKPFENGSFQKR